MQSDLCPPSILFHSNQRLEGGRAIEELLGISVNNLSTLDFIFSLKGEVELYPSSDLLFSRNPIFQILILLHTYL